MITTNIVKAFLLLFLVQVASAVPLLGVDELGSTVAVSPRDSHLPTRTVSPAMSNAERLRRGLPLKKPMSRSLRYRQDGPVPSNPVTIYRRGYIQILSAADDRAIGYVSSTPHSAGPAGLTSSTDSALIVRYDVGMALTPPYNLELTNGQGSLASFPDIGLTVGPSALSPEFGPGSFNYGFLSATNPTPKGSTPTTVGSSTSSTLPGESAIFTVDPFDNIQVQWINPDGSLPVTYTMYAPGPNYLTATGDINAYKDAFGNDRIQVLYKFVEVL
ncbi:hypothetical protein DL96DRAFT_1684281 [Flagelloscypha sp. PMI_526]|nr:hypothetical protein DL96DRAFT_1684281 [Flagelloscypha sp. PMI_526]